MGLDIIIDGEPLGSGREHQIWHGAYSAFAIFRAQIAACLDAPSYREIIHLGYPLDAHPIYKTIEREVNESATPGLYELLTHHDSDGRWTPKECALVIQALEKALPRLPLCDHGGHIGNWRKTTEKFIRGLKVCIEKDLDAIFC